MNFAYVMICSLLASSGLAYAAADLSSAGSQPGAGRDDAGRVPHKARGAASPAAGAPNMRDRKPSAMAQPPRRDTAQPRSDNAESRAAKPDKLSKALGSSVNLAHVEAHPFRPAKSPAAAAPRSKVAGTSKRASRADAKTSKPPTKQRQARNSR